VVIGVNSGVNTSNDKLGEFATAVLSVLEPQNVIDPNAAAPPPEPDLN
jgi:hypothetical protein